MVLPALHKTVTVDVTLAEPLIVPASDVIHYQMIMMLENDFPTFK